MVESKLVELVVAGSSPVGHPTLLHQQLLILILIEREIRIRITSRIKIEDRKLSRNAKS